MPNVFSVFLTRSGLKTPPNWPSLLFVFLPALTHPELGINRQIFIKQCSPLLMLSQSLSKDSFRCTPLPTFQLCL